jgi:hypothetical protein
VSIRAVNNIISITPATNINSSRKDIVMPSALSEDSDNTQKSNFLTKDINSVNPALNKTQKEDPKKIKENSEEQSVKSNPAQQELNEEEQKRVNELKRIDQKVRTHEQAHVAAGGSLIKGGVRFSYQTGPDNKKYAVAGKVNIDVSPVKGDAEATIRKMQTVKRAALAPADPSPQDRQIATSAAQTEAKARMQLQREKSVENESQYSNIAKAASNRFVDEYKKQQDISENLILAGTSSSGVLSKRV